jgi:hypothetical protein
VTPHQPRPSTPEVRRTAETAAPPAADHAAEVVHHPRRFMRDRLPIGADRAI